MRKKILLGVLLIGLLVLVGCSVSKPEASPTVTPYVPPSNQLWITPGRVPVGNCTFDVRYEQTYTIHNGYPDREAIYNVYYRTPESLVDGYLAPPRGADDWVTFSETQLVLEPLETRGFLVALEVPSGIVVPDKWEFWVGFSEESSAMVQIRLNSRWLVDMMDVE